MPVTAVQDNLEVPLAEAKEWLRVTDLLITTVTSTVTVGSSIIPVDDASSLKKNLYLTVNDISYLITFVDYDANTIEIQGTVDEEISASAPVYAHPHDRLIMRLIAASKSEADNYLNNPFKDNVIPPEVKTWVLRRVALHYERPEAGVIRVSVDDAGSKTYGDDVYADINHLRLYPL